MYPHLLFLSIVVSAAPGWADEAPPLPPPDAGTLIPVRPTLLPRADAAALQQQLAQLKAQREALREERDAAGNPMPGGAGPASEQLAALRRRAAQLMVELAQQEKQRQAQPPPKATAPVSPVPPPVRPSVRPQAPLPSREKPEVKKPAAPPVKQTTSRPAMGLPVDPLALAQALFRTGDFEAALATYRSLDLGDLKPAERVTVQYMSATCLRKLGKAEEAAALYREVANSKEDAALAECAQWQLGALRWRRDVEGDLEQMRQQRKNLETVP